MYRQIMIITALLFILQGCAAPYSKFYVDMTDGDDFTKLPSLKTPWEEPKVFYGKNQEDDYQNMIENGYMMIGYSSFNASNVDQRGAISQAKSVHAYALVLYSKYTHTVSGAIPLTIPNTTTSSTTFSGNVYGLGGDANYTGTANTTKYGTKTTYIPYSVNRSDYIATYWVKIKPAVFGVRFKTPTNKERANFKTNKGMIVMAVINGSPAFRADIFKGDLLQKIGDINIYEGNDFHKGLKKYSANKTNITILRNGELITKEVAFNSIY